MQLTLMTYNVHSCRSPRMEPTLDEIAKLIRSHAPDVVALQELDRGLERTDGIDQIGELAERTDMESVFSPLVHREEGEYGFGFLYRKSLRKLSSETLLLPKAQPGNEQRGLLRLELSVLGEEITVFNTHLSTNGREQTQQLSILLEHVMNAHEKDRSLALLGDFNAVQGSRSRRRLARHLHVCLPRQVFPATFPSRRPLFLLDSIYVNDKLEKVSAEIPRSPMARTASDHLPVLAKVQLTEKEQG